LKYDKKDERHRIPKTKNFSFTNSIHSGLVKYFYPMVPEHCDDNSAVLVYADAGWVVQDPPAKAAEVAPVLVEHLDSI